MEEAITPEDTEAKPTNDNKSYHLLRPKAKVQEEDSVVVVVDDKREKEEEQEQVDANNQEKDNNESPALTQPTGVVDNNPDSSETEETKEGIAAEEMIKGEEEITTDEKLLEPTPDEEAHERSPEKPSVDGSFTLERLKATREAAQNLVSMLEQYYNGVEQSKNMMLESWLLPWEFDPQTNDTDKVVMKDKIVDTMTRALVTNDQKEFIIGTIGSSVAAGHDNCNFDSYERQMERNFGPVWEAAGMKLVCQNAGEGGGCGDDFSNQVFCIKQNVSPNIDIAQ